MKTRKPIGPKSMDFGKYSTFQPIDLPNRKWPSNSLLKAPRWCSVDLRDGNQALLEPMTPAEKLQFFELLLDVGFKEIEVGFPSASETDFAFVRKIIEQSLIPQDVVIQVLCQARKDLIDRTAVSLEGAPSAIFHLYNSTSTLQRKVVFRLDKKEIINLALKGVRWVAEVIKTIPGTDITLEYSPESFTGTELDFAVEICERVRDEWARHQDGKIILNLPATVEMAGPNVYADQIEGFLEKFSDRDSIILSLHTHNDRGTAVAATEMGLLAGADRVEGTLFGNGERTGNVDIISLAMNLFSQGLDPELDFGDMEKIRQVSENCTKLPVHPRHPYAGELVFTAFSGSHQDAIQKGIQSMEGEKWEVPYLPIDPADVGSSYRETVRVNSQSGKGGVAFILQHHYGIMLTRSHLINFSPIVQNFSEQTGKEARPGEIWRLFSETYAVQETDRYKLLKFSISGELHNQTCTATLKAGDSEMEISGKGAGPIEAFSNALQDTFNFGFQVIDFHEYSLESGTDAKAIALATVEMTDSGDKFYGMGHSKNTLEASLNAIIASINQSWRKD